MVSILYYYGFLKKYCLVFIVSKVKISIKLSYLINIEIPSINMTFCPYHACGRVWWSQDWIAFCKWCVFCWLHQSVVLISFIYSIGLDVVFVVTENCVYRGLWTPLFSWKHFPRRRSRCVFLTKNNNEMNVINYESNRSETKGRDVTVLKTIKEIGKKNCEFNLHLIMKSNIIAIANL